MKAFVVEQYGKDGLRAADVPEPEVGDGDVLVKVSAASVNPLDKMVRNGEFKQLLKYRTPFVLGHDVAGVVTRVGSAVRDFQVGDEVYARPRDLRIGTFAEYIAIDQDDVAPKPDSLTLHEAAAVPLVSLAAWQALVDRAHLKPGQKVLVHAGSGGLGSTVIQLAKHLGATVATTASGKNAELVRSLGADVVVDYTEGGLRRRPLRLRRRAGLTRRRKPREVPHRPQARRTGDQRHWPAGPRVRQAARGAAVHGRRDGAAEPKGPQASPEARCELLVPVHAGQRRPAARAGQPSTTPATSARSSTRRSHLTRPSRRWRTSSRAAPTAKSSSHSTDNCERRPPPVTSNVAEDRAAPPTNRGRRREADRRHEPALHVRRRPQRHPLTVTAHAPHMLNTQRGGRGRSAAGERIR